jgi:hypothetical protein
VTCTVTDLAFRPASHADLAAGPSLDEARLAFHFPDVLRNWLSGCRCFLDGVGVLGHGESEAHLGTLSVLEAVMRLSFVGITPDTPDSECPAVYVDEDTGEIWFQGETVTDPAELAEVVRHSPIGPSESVVRLPPVMGPIILEAVNGTYERDRQGPGSHPRRG